MTESKPVSAEALAAELAAEVLERPKHLEQWDLSLVAVVIIAAARLAGEADDNPATQRSSQPRLPLEPKENDSDV